MSAFECRYLFRRRRARLSGAGPGRYRHRIDLQGNLFFIDNGNLRIRAVRFWGGASSIQCSDRSPARDALVFIAFWLSGLAGKAAVSPTAIGKFSFRDISGPHPLIMVNVSEETDMQATQAR
ncbi:MAG TPA: hypothetical protein VGK99_22050 [Acidobacteriota bacterium]